MNLRFLIPMMLTAFFELSVISIMRVTTSYRAIELQLSPAWIGILTAAFAILPVMMALKVGRAIDRGNDAATVWIGAGLMVFGCAGFVLFPTLPGLLAATAVLGIGHLFVSIGVQVLCARQPGPGVMERTLGNYMIATAVGQGVGPAIVGWAGGSAAIPPTEMLFWIGLAFSGLAFAGSLLLRPSKPPDTPKSDKPVPVRDIFLTPGFRIVFAVSIITVVAQDLIVVYLPLLGTERGLSVDVVGTLLAVRAIAAVISRFFFARLSLALGRSRLMVFATFAGAGAYLCLAAPFPFPVMYVSIAVLGAALGIAVTAAISSVLGVVSDEVRGTANSLRTSGTRLGQVVIPFAAGVLAAATGVASVFFIIGASLAVTASAAQYRGRRV